MFPIEIIRQFLRSRPITIAFRRTCKEYSELTGFGWGVQLDLFVATGWSDAENRLTINSRMLTPDEYTLYTRECVLAGISKRAVCAGKVTYKTNAYTARGEFEGFITGCSEIDYMFWDVCDPHRHGNEYYFASIVGHTAAGLAAVIELTKAMLVPSKNGVYDVIIQLHLPAGTWKWLGFAC